MKMEAVTLEGKFVKLEPLCLEHQEGLCEAISDGELWNLHVTRVPHPNDISEFLSNATEAYENGDGLAFATIDRSTMRIAGSTRFMKADFPNKRIEIGFTFLGKTWQRTRINTEAKFLMLSHAFEVLQVNRLEIITDHLNNASRSAILRLGAKEEGILRNHMVMRNGRVRDSVLYTIIKSEWPSVKQNLLHKLV